MKEKILALLKTKYKNLGFDAKALDGVAEYLSKTVTEEDKVDEAVTGAFDLLKVFQAEADRRTLAAVEKAKKEKTGGDSEKKDDEPAKDDDTPSWAKKLIQDNQALAEKVLAMEQGKSTDTRKQQLEKELEKAPESFRKVATKNFERLTFKDDEDFNTFLTDLKTDAAEFETKVAQTGLGAHHQPAFGGKAQTQKQIDSAIEGWAKKHAPKETA